MTKLFLLGLDGATFDLLLPMIDEGHLNNCKKIIQEGAYGTLISTFPPITCPAWTSLATGKNPGKTGVYDVFNLTSKNNLKYSVMTSKDIQKNKPLWDYLNNGKNKIAVVNYPFLFPPYNINGIMISGLGSDPDDEIFYPENIKNVIRKMFPNYKIDIPFMNEEYLDDPNKFFNECKDLLYQNEKMINYLLKSKYDIIIMVISATDLAQHFIYKHIDKNHPQYDVINSKIYYEKFIEIWEIVDLIIGNIIDTILDVGNLIIVSDHGFGKHTKNFYNNVWLEKKGYLVKKTNYISRIKLLFNDFLKKYFPFIQSKIVIYLKSKNISPRLEKYKSIISEINMDKTIAFMPISTSGQGMIFLNESLINKKNINKNNICDRIKRELKYSLNKYDIDVKFISPKEIYVGKYVKYAPNIMFYLNNFEISVLPSLNNREYLSDAPKSHTGNHKMNGIFMSYGKDIKYKGKIKDLNIMDVTPSILKLFNIEIPKDIDGKIIEKLFI